MRSCSLYGVCPCRGSLRSHRLASAGTIAALTGIIRDFPPEAARPLAPITATQGRATTTSRPISHPGYRPQRRPANARCATAKPVFDPDNAGSVYVSTTTEANFNEWFNNTPGKNLSHAHSITLDDSASPGVYTYDNSAFFPIDGQLYGNNAGWDHNFGFTFELHTTFGYQPGQVFSFTGDDDLWVFINGQRVINLGGVHAALGQTVDLNTLGLLAGQNYSLDIFFAERHTVKSTFKIQTTIPLSPRRPTTSSPPNRSAWSWLEPASLASSPGVVVVSRRNRQSGSGSHPQPVTGPSGSASISAAASSGISSSWCPISE